MRFAVMDSTIAVAKQTNRQTHKRQNNKREVQSRALKSVK